MPIYEYECASCEQVFEELILRRSDEDDLACPRCATPHPRRVLSAPALHGAGGGEGGGAACVPRGGFS